MNIEKIFIDSFGKFERFELDFSNGLNVIYGNNEDGKSTLMAFVRMMFYGDTSRSRNNIREKLRDLYRPWHSDRMGGTLVLCVEGIRYQIDRKFGKTNSSDKIKITNLDTGLDVSLMRNQEPGQHFLGLGLEAFEKSVYIGQNGSLISGTGKDDEIMQRLLNLVTTGEENTSYKKVADKLDAARQRIQGRQRAKGLLPESQNRLHVLQAEREQALHDEREKAAAQLEIERMQNRQQELSARRDQLRSQLRLLAVVKEQQEIENAIRRRRDLDQKIARLSGLKQDLQRPDISLDDNFISTAKQRLNEYDQLTKNLEEIEVQQQEQQRKLEMIETAAVVNIPEGRTEALRQLEKDIENTSRGRQRLADDIDKLAELMALEQDLAELTETHEGISAELEEVKAEVKLASAEYEAKKQEKNDKITEQKAIKAELEELQRRKHQAELELNNAENSIRSVDSKYELRIEIAEQQLAKAKQPQKFTEDIPAGREVNKPLAAAGIAIVLLGLILGIIIDPLLFLLIIAAAVMLLFSVRKVPARTISKQITDSQAVEQAEVQLKNERQNFEKEKSDAVAKLESIQTAFAKVMAQETELQKQLDELDGEMTLLEQHLELADGDHDEKNAKLTKLAAALESSVKQLEHLTKSVNSKRQQVAEKLALDDFKSEVLINESRQQLAELNSKYEKLNQELAEGLGEFAAPDLASLYQLEKLWHSHKLQLDTAANAVKEFADKIAETKEKLQLLQQDLLVFVSSYMSAESVDRAAVLVEELEQKIDMIITLEAEITGYQSSIESTGDISLPELEANLQQLEQHLYDLKASIGAEITSAACIPDQTVDNSASGDNSAVEEPVPVDLSKLEQDIANLDVQINELGSRIAGSQGSIREKYRKLRNVSQIENEIDQLEQKIRRINDDFEILGMASEVMEDAFAEVQRSFGPLVNSKTAAIFRELTQGRYSNVTVSRDFAITFENSSDRTLREWGYLSSGTIDQAYLSLRLAITELVNDGREALPLLLDDIFTLYDDTRAAEGMRFISQYRQNVDEQQQILLFTCHSRIADLGAKLGANAIVLAGN